MLNVQVIGNLGSDAVIREFNGKKSPFGFPFFGTAKVEMSFPF